MSDITVKKIDGWWYVYVNGRRDRYGYSTATGALDRVYSIRDGWI